MEIEERLKNIGKDCITIMRKKMLHEMSSEEYYLALLNLDRKYPGPQRKEPLTKEKYQNYKKFELQPINFKEAAEMYIQNKIRIEKDYSHKNDGGFEELKKQVERLVIP